ncbi:DUF4345 domain-containing protein (plasmid) [Rhodobacteraceae bacterium SC52]|nr:DUF4345 domain-containing protein [Rhodobacteraceae bacterium SC52]
MQCGFLLVAAVGLTPIALSYGLFPGASLSWLFGIDAGDVNTRHIFRAIMGLYLAMVVFWVIGAVRTDLRVAALWSLVVFMIGLALGRMLSLTVDGWPHPLLVVYMILEFGFAFVGWKLLHPTQARTSAR